MPMSNVDNFKRDNAESHLQRVQLLGLDACCARLAVFPVQCARHQRQHISRKAARQTMHPSWNCWKSKLSGGSSSLHFFRVQGIPIAQQQ